MLDAYGRFPEGISQGSKTDLGMFDQCLNIRQNFDDDVDIKGKYCYGGLVIPLLDISLNVSEVDEAVSTFAYLLIFCIHKNDSYTCLLLSVINKSICFLHDKHYCHYSIAD